jgi:hypothetical protein
MQIQQLVSGFGGFNLEDRDTLRCLDNNGIFELKAQILDNYFVCDDCGHKFNPYKDEERKFLIYKLFDAEIERNLEKIDTLTLKEMLHKLRQQETEIELELDERQCVDSKMNDTYVVK